MKHNSPRLTDGISRFLITVMGIVMMIAGIRLLIMGVDNFIQPIRHAGWVYLLHYAQTVTAYTLKYSQCPSHPQYL